MVHLEHLARWQDRLLGGLTPDSLTDLDCITITQEYNEWPNTYTISATGRERATGELVQLGEPVTLTAEEYESRVEEQEE